MKTKIWFLSMALLLCFSACATQKETSLAPSASADFKTYLWQGSTFLKQGEIGKAIIQLDRAIALNPNSPQAHNLLGIAYFKQENYKLAEEQLKKAIELDESYAQAYNNLGSVYFMSREFDQAEKMFKNALSLDSSLVSTYYSLGTLLINQSQFEEGLKYLSKGIELDPEFLEKNKAFTKDFSSYSFSTAEVNFTYAKLYAMTGNVDKAIFYLKLAKKAGFVEWNRVDTEKEFEKIKDDPRIREVYKY